MIVNDGLFGICLLKVEVPACISSSACQTYQANPPSLPSNFLCLATNVVLIVWLLPSTKFSNSTLLCWLSLSSISDVQQVNPWGQTRRCSPEGDRNMKRHFYTHQCRRIQFFKRLSWVFDQNSPVISGLSSPKLSKRDRAWQMGKDNICR